MAGAVLFAVTAALALAGGIGVIASRRPVHSALSLLLVLGSLAVDYLLLGAQFIAALQVIIYAGAIVLGHQYELSGYSRDSLIFTKDRLTEAFPGESGRDPHREV